MLCRCEVLKQAIGKVNVDLTEAHAEAKRLGAEIVEVRQPNLLACLPSCMHACMSESPSPSDHLGLQSDSAVSVLAPCSRRSSCSSACS